MIKTRKVTKKETEYFTKCSECDKEIKGSTQSQVQYNLDIHIKAKHEVKE